MCFLFHWFMTALGAIFRLQAEGFILCVCVWAGETDGAFHGFLAATLGVHWWGHSLSVCALGLLMWGAHMSCAESQACGRATAPRHQLLVISCCGLCWPRVSHSPPLTDSISSLIYLTSWVPSSTSTAVGGAGRAGWSAPDRGSRPWMMDAALIVPSWHCLHKSVVSSFMCTYAHRQWQGTTSSFCLVPFITHGIG